MRRLIIPALILLFCCTLPALAQDTPIPIVSATASSDDGNVAGNAVDGDLKTRWSADGDGQWLQLDLGGTFAVSSVRIAWYKGDQRISSFELTISLDAQTWQTIYVGQSSGTTLDLESFTFSAAQARYVRYIGHGNSISGWNSVTEAQVFEAAPQPPTIKQVTFRWTDDLNPQVDGYRIYYGTQSGTYTGHVQVGDVREATVGIPVLADKMVFAATAFLSDAESDFSEEIAGDMTASKPQVTLSAPTINEVIVQ